MFGHFSITSKVLFSHCHILFTKLKSQGKICASHGATHRVPCLLVVFLQEELQRQGATSHFGSLIRGLALFLVEDNFID